MDKRIYKTQEECVKLHVSDRVYVVVGEGYSIEDIASSFYYGVKRLDSQYRYYFFSGNFLTFADIVKAVNRRGVSATIGDSYDSDDSCGSGGQPSQWGHYKIHPTFRVDDILCVCTGLVDGVYLFLPLSEFIKQLKKQKVVKDEYDHQRYLGGDY